MRRRRRSELEAELAQFTQSSIYEEADSQEEELAAPFFSYCSFFSVLLFLVSLASFVIFILLYARMGMGGYLPAQPTFATEAILPESVLEVVAELPLPPGNIAVSRTGRIFFNFHPDYDPITKIAELDPVTKTWTAYPNEGFQRQIISCLSMRIDQQDRSFACTHTLI